MRVFPNFVTTALVALAAALLVGCNSTPLNKAPVEDRSKGASASSTSGTAPAPKPPPGIENAGKPGYYTVKPGDTLIRIGLENGQSWKDIARWNNLDNPNLIEVGQVLRVAPPGAQTASSTAPASGGAVTHPVASSSAATAAPTASSASAPKSSAAPAGSASTAVATAAPSPAASATPSSAMAEDDISFIWPASGSLIAGFDEARNKGYDIAGKAGDPVYAAADGRVVYAGAGLRGYGNLIILKHNNTFLTAYAHNQTLLVKEDQTVKRGQKIAEMGNTDADRVKLHFEIRKQGKPVDPARYLPPR
jgi:lipoprotein NlpD